MGTATMPAPLRLDDLGVRRTLLEDLALKILYLHGEMPLDELAEQMHINLNIGDEIFQQLRRQQFIEVTGMSGVVHRITATSAGKGKAAELLTSSQYAGPAPVSLTHYISRVRSQTVRVSQFRPAEIEAAFRHLVLEPQLLARLGAALASGRAIFLHGPTGTGKTSIAETLSHLMARENVWIPYAVEVDGQIITVFDPNLHHVADDASLPAHDQRWVLCKRPRVLVGGELTVEMLDLQFNQSTKFYTAPIQMKANNGMLIVDDFGRQRVHPHELLNRWVVPLDRHIDFLTLAGGKKLEIPFDLFVVFATNLEVGTLVDDAFLRRIQTKIKVDYATPEQFHKIFQNVCSDFKVPYAGPVVDHAIKLITGTMHQALRPCYPRDLMQQIVWMAKYLSHPPVLDDASLIQACENYFVEPEE
jgi:predicted ATPase with chaperone activity